MEFSDLLRDLGRFAGLAIDSRKVCAGDVYVSGGGPATEHVAYLDQAVRRGAAVVVGERAPAGLAVPFVVVPDFRAATAELAAHWYGHPSRKLRVIGVTGTCGKTTTTYLIESILRAAGERVGVIGTVSYRYPGLVEPASHTTPDAVRLQQLFDAMRRADCTSVVMEVSSHAIAQKRVDQIAFDVAVFTNFSLEHLDYHGSLDEYFAAKRRLFLELVEPSRAAGKSHTSVVNADDLRGQQLLAAIAGTVTRRTGYSPRRWLPALTLGSTQTTGAVDGIEIASHLVGAFNAENIVAAVTVARVLGIDPVAISAGIRDVRSVPGRLESIPSARGVRCFVDYAHKPGALERVLHELRQLAGDHRLVAVFGCGGDRDRAKRPVMGEIAARIADVVWITSDNPRSEHPQAIIDDIVRGAAGTATVHVEIDRRRAIHHALTAAGPDDVVVIAGRGPEPDLLIGDARSAEGVRRVAFDDRVVAAEVLAAAEGGAPR